jgi:carboxyl-terminal processing protease
MKPAAKAQPADSKDVRTPNDAPEPGPVESRREKVLSRIITTLMVNQHLRPRGLDNALSGRVLDRYIEALDPAKLFLLQGDVQEMRAYQDQVDDQLLAGDLDVARDGAALLKRRVAVVQAVVTKRLGEPFAWDKDESLETDAEKRAYAADEAALAERWRKVLKLQTLERMERIKEIDKTRQETKSPIPEAEQGKSLEERARMKLREDYDARFKRLSKEGHFEMLDTLFNAYLADYDPHSVWLAPAQKENFDIRMSGRLEGIGAVLGVEQHYVKVVRVVPGSASWRQGDLEAEDVVLMVAQGGEEPVDVVDMRLNDVVHLIRGKKGTEVRLTVKKPDGRILIIPIVRDVVRIEESFARGAILNVPGVDEPVGYIHLPSFYGGGFGGGSRSSSRDVRLLLEKLQAKKVKSVILDLRSNGGGLLQDAIDMSGLFFDEGPVVQTRFSGQNSRVLRDSDPKTVFDGNLVVMVNRFSASASEIVSGALQDYGRAVIVGTSATHGKGTVQVVRDLSQDVKDHEKDLLPLGVLKLTTQQFFRVNGASTQQKGVEPDVLLPDPLAHIDAGEATLDNAIPWSEVPPANYKKLQPSWMPTGELQKLSRTRQAQQPAFQRVRQRTELLKEQREQTVETLQRDTWVSQREARLKKLEELTPETKDEPKLFSVRVIGEQDKPQVDPGDRKVGEDPLKRWRENLERDAWVRETVNILQDMQKQ